MTDILWGIIACGALSILYAYITAQSVMKADAGNAKMQEIAGIIREGASAYLNRQYRTIAIVGGVIFLLAIWLLLNHLRLGEAGGIARERVLPLVRLEGAIGGAPDNENLPELRGDAIIYLWNEVDVDEALGYHDLNAGGVPFGSSIFARNGAADSVFGALAARFASVVRRSRAIVL